MEGKLPSQREQFARFVRPLDGEQVKARVIAAAALVGGLYAVISLIMAVLPDWSNEQNPTPGNGSVPDSTMVKAFAREFVAMYLTAKRGDEAKLNNFVTVDDIQLPPVASEFSDSDVTFVEQRYAGSDGLSLWTVIVSGVVNGSTSTNATRSYFQVPVTMLDGGCRATDLPAQLATPKPGVDMHLDYRNTVDLDAPLGRAAAGFVTAYLTGGSDFSRYITADSTEDPIVPPPYLKVDVVDIKSDVGANDATTARVYITVIARTKNYTLTQLHYPLAMRAVEGRWQVSAIAAIPAVQLNLSEPGEPTPTPTTTTVAPPTPTRG